MSKEPVVQFLTKEEFVKAFANGKYSHVEPNAVQNIVDCAPHDVIGIQVVTGSNLKVLDAFKLDEEKFIELTQLS